MTSRISSTYTASDCLLYLYYSLYTCISRTMIQHQHVSLLMFGRCTYIDTYGYCDSYFTMYAHLKFSILSLFVTYSLHYSHSNITSYTISLNSFALNRGMMHQKEILTYKNSFFFVMSAILCLRNVLEVVFSRKVWPSHSQIFIYSLYSYFFARTLNTLVSFWHAFITIYIVTFFATSQFLNTVAPKSRSKSSKSDSK